MTKLTNNISKVYGLLILILIFFFFSFKATLGHDLALKNPDVTHQDNNPSIHKVLKIKYNGTQDYAIYQHELGKGSYSRVLLAQNMKTFEWLAVKIQPYLDPDDIHHEIKHLSLTGNYRGNTIVKNTHYLFMRLVQGFTIEKLYEKNLRYSPEEIFEIIMSSFYALQKLHQKNILHNDIHEGNLIYDSLQKTSQWVDLAFSIKLKPTDTIYHLRHVSKKSAFCYNAPESTKHRGYATDIYQLGFMSLRLLLILSEENNWLRKKYIDSKTHTFETLKEKQKTFLSKTPSKPVKKIFSLLYSMIEPNAEERPMLDDAVYELKINLNKFKLMQQFTLYTY